MNRPAQLEYKVCAPMGRFETKSPATTYAEYKGAGTIERSVENPDQVTATENGPVGEVQFYAAVTGVRDEVGDIIVPGAFDRSLKARLPRVCLGHDWNRPIGRTVEVKELRPGDPALPRTTSTGDPWPREAGALWVKALYNLRSEDGRKAFDDAVFMGKSATYSIGYVAQRHETKSGTRHLYDVDLWEYGPVLHPANTLATGISAKGTQPDGLETKTRYVRDSDFWGLPIGTPIKPGMKPRGRTAVAMRRQGRVPSRDAGAMEVAPDTARRAQLEAEQSGRSRGRALADIRAEQDEGGLFGEDPGVGRVRATRSARGADGQHLDAVHADSAVDGREDEAIGGDRGDLAVHELTDGQRQGLRGLLDEGITPDEVDEELPDDIAPDHRASIMSAYRAAYSQRAEQQGGKPATGRSPEVPQQADPEATPTFGQAARAQREAAEAPAPAPAPAAPAGRGKTPRELAADAFRRGNQPGGDPGDQTPAHVDDPAVDRASLSRTLHQGAQPGNVGPARSVNGARTYLDRAGASAPREQHDPVQAAVTMAKGMLARGVDSDPARDVRGLRQAMEHAGIDDHEMGRRLDAIDSLADSMDSAGLGGVKGKGRSKPVVQSMRDYAAAARAELGHQPETDYRDRRGGGGTDAGLPDTAPGSKPSDTPSADRVPTPQDRSLAGTPDQVRERREANEAAMTPPGDADSGPNSVAPARAQQIAGQFLSPDGRRGRGTVQDAGRYSDDELEAAARQLDNQGTPGARAAAGLRDFIGHRRREQERRERPIGLDATKPDLRDSESVDGPEHYRERLSKLDDATLAQALRRNDEMARTGQGPTRAQATDMAAAIRDIQRERREGGGGAPTPGERNEAAARQLEADTVGTPGEEAGRRNAADLRATPEELEARYGAPNTDDQTAPGDDRAQLATRARNAAADGNQEGLEAALEDLGHPDPESAAERITMMRGGKRAREAAARAEIMRAQQGRSGQDAPSSPTAGERTSMDALDGSGDGFTPAEDGGNSTLSADDLAELDRLGDPDTVGDTDPRAEQDVRDNAVVDIAQDGEPSVARSKIPGFARDGDNRAFVAADNPITPKVRDAEMADAALARKVSLGEVDPQTAQAVRAGHADGSPQVYGHEIRTGDTVVDPTTGQPVRVHGTTVRPNGDLTIRALDPDTQDSREFDISPAALADRAERPTGGDQQVAEPGDNAVVGTGQPDLRAREAAAAMAGDEGDGFTAEEDAAAAQGISRAELDEARAEAHQQQDSAMGIAELPDGDVEVEPEVADRQSRVEGLLTRAGSGRLDLKAQSDDELGGTRQDLVDELALQDSLHRRNPQAYNASAGSARGQVARDVPDNAADVADVETAQASAPTPRRRPGVAGAAEDYAEALESGVGVADAKENLRKSLRRSGASGEHVDALRDEIADDLEDARGVRRAVEGMKAETRARRNASATRRRTAKRLERERIRSLIGQVDAEMRTRNMSPDDHGGKVPDAVEAAKLDAIAEAAAARSPALYALCESDADRKRLAEGKMIDAQYRERVSLVEAKAAEAIAAGLETHKRYADGKDDKGEPNWTPERRAQHDALIEKFWAKHVAHVPREGKAMFSGGLGGAGKGTILGKDNLAIDHAQFAGIDPDEIKVMLADANMVDLPAGVSPMEMATLMHEESSYLSKRIQARAIAERRNLVLDNTMAGKNGDKVRKIVGNLRDNGYGEINAAFVEIPVETSVERALSRHRNGADRFMNPELAKPGEPNLGGRYVPPSVIRDCADPDGIRSSQNIKNFEEVSDLFDNWAHYDNSGKAPVFVKGKGVWATDPRLRDSEGGSTTGDVLEPVPTSPGMIDDAGANGPPDLDYDGLARMTHDRRKAATDDMSADELQAASDEAKRRAAEMDEGPQQRRMAKMGTELSNRAISREMDDDRAARIAGGEDPRQWLWNGSDFSGGAKRAKVNGGAFQVGDTIRVPPGAIMAAQRRGFDGTIVSEGVTGDGVAQAMAISSPGRPVFHVQRHSDGRLIEVSKPGGGRQRGVGLELYHPDRAPQNPNAPATPDEPDAVNLDAPDSPINDSSTTLDDMTPEHVAMEPIANLRNRPNYRNVGEALAIRLNDLKRRTASGQGVGDGDDPAAPEVADIAANNLAARFLGSAEGVNNSPAAAANVMVRRDEGRGTGTAIGDAQADALDRLADALDANGAGHVTRQRSGDGVSGKLRETARLYRERRDVNTPEAIEARGSAAREVRDRNAPAPGMTDTERNAAVAAGQAERAQAARDAIRAEVSEGAARYAGTAHSEEGMRSGGGLRAAASAARMGDAGNVEGARNALADAIPRPDDANRRGQNPNLEAHSAVMTALRGESLQGFRDPGGTGGMPDAFRAQAQAIRERLDTADTDGPDGRLGRAYRGANMGEIADQLDAAADRMERDGRSDRSDRPDAPAAGQQRAADTAASRLTENGAATAPALGEAMRVPPRGLGDRAGLTPAANPQPGDLIYAPAQGRMRGAVVTKVSRNGRVTYEFSNPTSAGRAFDDALRGRGRVREAGGPEAYRRQRAAERQAFIDERNHRGDMGDYYGQMHDQDTERAIRNAGLARPDDVHPGSVSRTSKPDEVFEVPAGQRGIADDRSFDDDLVGAGGASARG